MPASPRCYLLVDLPVWTHESCICCGCFCAAAWLSSPYFEYSNKLAFVHLSIQVSVWFRGCKWGEHHRTSTEKPRFPGRCCFVWSSVTSESPMACTISHIQQQRICSRLGRCGASNGPEFKGFGRGCTLLEESSGRDGQRQPLCACSSSLQPQCHYLHPHHLLPPHSSPSAALLKAAIIGPFVKITASCHQIWEGYLKAAQLMKQSAKIHKEQALIIPESRGSSDFY